MTVTESLTHNQNPLTLSVPAGLKQRSILLMIVFTLMTSGLYYAIWFWRRRAALNRLDSPKKIQGWPFSIFLAWFVVQFIVSIASGPTPVDQTVGAVGSLLLTIARLAVGILMLVQCFFTKDILEDHLAGPDNYLSNPLFFERVQLSGVMTFLFQIFYLQYVINRHIVGQPKAV